MSPLLQQPYPLASNVLEWGPGTANSRARGARRPSFGAGRGLSPATLASGGRPKVGAGMSCSERVECDQELQFDLANVVQSIAQAGNSARMLECHYWTQEPGLLELIRAFLAMPVEAQTALRAFLAAAVVRSSITASVDAAGTLSLRSPEAAPVLASLFSHGPSASSRYLV